MYKNYEDAYQRFRMDRLKLALSNHLDAAAFSISNYQEALAHAFLDETMCGQ